MRCRHCHAPSANLIADLGVQPPSNSYLQQSDLCKEEIFLPLQLYVCEKCFLLQIRDYTVKENFFTPFMPTFRQPQVPGSIILSNMSGK